MKNRRKGLERMSEMLEIPGQVIAGMPKLAMSGNRHLHIESHNGVLEYDRDLIMINGGAMILKIHGAELEITSMNADELLITGNISKFEFEPLRGAE